MFRSSSFQKKKNDVWLNLTFSVPIVECTIRKAVSGRRKWPAQLVNPVKLRRSYITSSTKKNIKIKGWTKEKREYPKIVWLWIRFEWKTSSTMSELKGWRWRHCNWLVTALLACPLVVVADNKSSTGQWSQETGDKRARHGKWRSTRKFPV
jgi:hypothetical protein